MRRIRWLLVAGILAAALGAVSQVGARTDSVDASQLKIGISLPLTGNFSEPGQAARDGYNIWASLVNKKGGLLGRKVQLIVRDDGSDQNTIVSDYNRLISEDHVDLLLGTFSSLLNLPASSVAEKNRMVFVAPAGGSPALFARHYHYYFFAQQATAPHQGDLFSAWVKRLPDAQRPKTVAYPSIVDPFAQPVVNGIRTKLEALGIQTVYNKAYPGTTTDFDTIAAQIKASGADAVVSGATFEDGVGLIRSMIKLGYNPKFMFQTTAPTEGSEFANAIGATNTNGIMTAISYAPAAKGKRFPQNHEFLVAYEKGHKGQLPAEDAADAFASAQVLQAAVNGTKSFDQDKMADWLHSHVVRTILGPLSWDQDGAPRQAFFLMQWQKNRPAIVSPKYLAQTKKILFPKPVWH
jgi:branched-chain amino acid transport system substrate-binding protein